MSKIESDGEDEGYTDDAGFILRGSTESLFGRLIGRVQCRKCLIGQFTPTSEVSHRTVNQLYR